MLRPRHRLPRGGNCCDFCSTQEVHSLYSCLNFKWEGTPVFRQDVGRWAACYVCAHYIEDHKWGQISRRVMREVAKRQGITVAELDAMRLTVKDLHAQFALHMVKGEALTIHLPHVRRVLVTGQ